MRHLGDTLSAYLDGEVSAEERRRIAEHLAGCETCRAELEDVAFARSAVRGLPLIDPPQIVPPAARRSLAPLLRGIAASVVLLLGVGAVAALTTPDPIPAGELSVLYAAYTAEGPEVESFVPVPVSTPSSQPENLMLPGHLAGVERSDLRKWGDSGSVAFYEDGRSTFVVLYSRRPIDTDGFVGVEVTTKDGKSYVGSWGDETSMYVWEVDGGFIALLGEIDPELVDDILAELPAPSQPGLLVRTWRDLTG